MKVTGKTITDDQLRELEATSKMSDPIWRLAQVGRWKAEGNPGVDVVGARQLCAAAWNARHGGA